MLDVFHFYFEEDMLAASSKEHLEVRDHVRRTLYREFYNREYQYASSTSSSLNASILDDELDFDEDAPPRPIDVEEESRAFAVPPKPYVPPTPVNANSAKPFGMLIDAPLG